MAETNIEDKNLKDLQNDWQPERIIVIGASAGGFEVIKKIIKGLPSDFSAPIFIVWHMSADLKGILPQVLNRLNTIPAVNAYHNEEIKPNRIFVAPPDHHMLLQGNKILVTHGPKENRFRPAVDPLFRSAAYEYGNRVIGIILSGALDDGTAGLWTIKEYGGIAIVQDPREAEVSSMPESAMRNVQVDHSLSLAEIPDMLVRLIKKPLPEKVSNMKDQQTKKEIEIATFQKTNDTGSLPFPLLTPYTCPECHGVLSRLQNDNIIRYRCHTGHAYSADSLLVAMTENVEESIYSAIRVLDESVILLNHLGEHYSKINKPELAELYFKKSKEADERAKPLRETALSLEPLILDQLTKEEASK